MEGITSTGNAETHYESLSGSIDSGKSQVAPVVEADDDDSDFYNTTANTPVDPRPRSTINNSEAATPQTNMPVIPGLSFFNTGQDSGMAQDPNSDEVFNKNENMDISAKSGVEPSNKATGNESHNSRPALVDTEMKDRPTNGQKMEPEETAIGKARVGDEQKNGDLQNKAGDSNGLEGDGAQNGESHENNMGMEDRPEWEADSSPCESSSTDTSSDSSSDDSDDDDGDDEYALLDPEEQARILMQAEGGSDNEGEGKGPKSGGGQIKTTNERPEEIVPKPEITVTPDMRIEFLGKVETIVENVALIKANTSGEYQVLEMGSVLCLENREVIGVVSETLGQVQQPLYTVRFPSIAALEEAGLKTEIFVYYVMSHSTFVFTQPLKGLKGSDASNFHDEEAGEDEIEFSDDEAEASYKRQLKQKKQERKEAKSERGGIGKPRRGDPRGPSNLSTTMELSYDDQDQDGYTPLVRPKNLHEMMGQQEAPLEVSQTESRAERPPDRGFRGRGRGGFDRGRGRGNRGKRGGGRYMHQQQSRDDYQQQSSSYDRHQDNQYSQPTMNQSPTQPFQRYNNPQSYPSQQQFPQSFSYNSNFPQTTSTTQQFSPPAQFSPQQNPFFPPPGSHINPAFFPMMQQSQPHQQQHQLSQPQNQNQNQADPFAAAQAQLDLLKRLSGYGGDGGQQGNSG